VAENEAQGEWVLPNEWAWTTIGEACEVNPRMTRPDGFDDDTPISFVPMAAIDEAGGVIASPETRPIGEVWRGYKRFAEGDVIFAKITPCMENGKAAIAKDLVNGIGLGSTEFHVLRPSDDVLSQWIYHFVRQASFRGDAAARMTGTAGQLRVPTTFVQEATIPLAPLPEQRRIVAEIETQFTRLDAGVAALERAQANLKRYRASVLKAACEGRLVPTEAALAREQGRDYEPADELLARILAERRARWEEERWAYEIERAQKKAAQAERKAAGLPYYIRDLPEESWIDRSPEEYEPYLPKSDKWKKKYDEPQPPDTEGLPALPEGWVWVTVQQLAEVQTGATPLRSNEVYYEGGRIPWVKSGAVNQPFIDESEEFITQLALEETSVKMLPKGSLLIAMYGEGRTRGKVSELRIEATTNQACAGLIFEGIASICRSFVKVFLQKNYAEIRRESSGGVQPNLNLTKIRTTVLPLPPLAEQHRIVAEVERRLSVVDALERAVETNLTRAERLRQAILKKAFEGRLVDQDPDDEPASALLERIRHRSDEAEQLELL